VARHRLHDRTRRLFRRLWRTDRNQHGGDGDRRPRDRPAADRDCEIDVGEPSALARRRSRTMSTRKTTVFYALLLMVASLFVGMVIASRLDLAPRSSAQTLNVAPVNSAPVTGPLDAQTFRNVAKMATPTVVNIRTEMKAKANDLTDFFGSGGS